MKYNIETFIKKAKEVHGDKYDYSKVDLENKDERGRICIICPEHGEFWQRPGGHLSGRGCAACSSVLPLTLEEFIKRAKEIHGDKYDYSKVNYKGRLYKVCILCPEHGEFFQFANIHLQGHGCPKCGRIKRDNSCKKSLDYIKEKCNILFNNKYKILNTDYNGTYSTLNILCPEHGIFKSTANRLLSGHSCPKCGGNAPLTTEEFIKRAKEIHGDKYDYSKVDFISTNKRVKIICPKHGEFLQFANGHLSGCGCPHCNQSSLEREVSVFLNKENIKYIHQKRAKWLGRQSLDFYLPEYNIAIECQGIQHFKACEHFGGEERFKKDIELDKNKYKLCQEHNIKILYYSHYNYKYDFELITDLQVLKNKIIN